MLYLTEAMSLAVSSYGAPFAFAPTIADYFATTPVSPTRKGMQKGGPNTAVVQYLHLNWLMRDETDVRVL